MTSIKVPPRGNPKAKIMVVGEAPGSHEEQELKPFVGPAGNILTEMLMKSGIDPEEVWYTNLCKYRPPANELKAFCRHGVPDGPLVEGLGELAQEIRQVNPNVIVPLGNYALYFLYGQKLNKQGDPSGITSYRGYVLEGRKLAKGKKIIPTFHPSYYLRGKYGEIPLGLMDLGKVRAEQRYPEVRRVPRETIVDPRGSEREAVRARLLEEGMWLGVDIEYIKPTLKWVGFAVSPSWATSIKIRSREDLYWCKELIESGKPLLFQNAMYDCGMLEWFWDIDAWKNLAYDTMVAAYNINMEYIKDLGFLGSMYTDVGAWWDVVDWDKIKAGLQDEDILGPYNCYDGMVTVETAIKQQPELDSDPKMREAFSFDMSKLKPLWDMAKRGCRLDTKRITALRTKSEADFAEAQVLLRDLADVAGFKVTEGCDFPVDSPVFVPEFLQGLGAKLTTRTGKGRFWKSDKVTLMELHRKTEDKLLRAGIETVLKARKAKGLQENFLDVDWDDDGRARCIYDCTKTGTRRLSSKEFFPTGRGKNLQNIYAPSSSPEYGTEVRSCWIPDDGFEFAYADLKSAEFLIVAEVTQDPLMLKFAEMVRRGLGSVHKETAALLFGGTAADYQKDTPPYFLGKKTRHSGNYMVGPRELMGRINAEALNTGVVVTQAETKTLIVKYTTELHPFLPIWWDEVKADAKRNRGRVRNLFGFVRLFHDQSKLPEMVAYIPQSTVGDCMNFAIVAMASDKELNDAGFQTLLQGHDAIGFQYPVENRAFVLRRVRQHMDVSGMVVPKTGKEMRIPVEISIGPSWGELKDYEEDLKNVAA
jgi:uracil-DNA glycosylase